MYHPSRSARTDHDVHMGQSAGSFLGREIGGAGSRRGEYRRVRVGPDRIERDAIDQVIDHVTLDTPALALGALKPADFELPMAGERLDEFDRFVRSTLLTDITAMVKVWPADGALFYSRGPGPWSGSPFGVVSPGA